MAARPAATAKMKEALLEALIKTMGIVTPACTLAGCSRDFYYDHYNNDPEFRRKADDLQEVALDFVESKLYESIQAGSDTATLFYMKTKGKKRGYGEDKAADKLPAPEESGRKLVVLSLRKRSGQQQAPPPAAEPAASNLPAIIP